MDAPMTALQELVPDGYPVLDTQAVSTGVLAVLIVGGGPAGTAAAFRAKELGLAVLVIELDDVLKRIRDYDRAKPIKPDFGAAKQMGFPKGGALIEKLYFFTDITGSDLCHAWKALYQRHDVPVQTGIELVGLEPGDAGVWRANVLNHRTGANGVICARHVVLALGAGTPRRLDVPGNVRAIADRLAGTDRYVGGPACVIGGGVSAIEAVVAISGAKAAATDDTPVYWSHRGDKMPAPPRALAAALDEAMSINRNVRFLPGSEAREIVETAKGPVLRLRVQAPQAGEPAADTPALEFDAVRVVACIGQEIDWSLFKNIGIHPVTGGTRVRKTFVLNGLLESRQSNVHVIGDTLNTAYLECDNFDGEPSEFREVKHRGNIKASLIDGVTVAEAIAQRLAGKTAVRVELDVVGAPATRRRSDADTSDPDRPRLPPPVALVRLIDREVEAELFELSADRDSTIGRHRSDICFSDDSSLADRHAAIVPGPDGYRVRDEGSPHGVFLHMTEGRGRVVVPGAIARIGSQWVVFGSTRDPLLLAHHDPRGRLVGRHRLREGTQIIGRDAPDITLARDDTRLSRRHASIVVTGTRVFVRDLNSVNGIYLKVAGILLLEEGDIIRVGHQSLRFGPLDRPAHSLIFSTRAGHARPPARPAPVEEAAAAEHVVVFRNRGQSCPFVSGQTVCEVAETNRVEITADCHAGICGSDPVRIVSGQAHMNPMSDSERATLEDICGVEPGVHRLACMARPTGAVVVEIVDG